MEHNPTEILKKYWGHDQFRPLQEDIIRSVLAGKDTLALLPTGGGKSICFQVPAMCLEGTCIVISPLIALMKDQVENLKRRGISAASVNSTMHRDEIDITLDNCVYGKIKFLYVSPERLSTELLIIRSKKMKISMIAVDEAHCISQWGYDFRPSYLKISDFREIHPGVPMIALTATATRNVVDDMMEKLCFKEKNVFLKSFERKNLSYSVLEEENKEERLLKIARKINGSGVVYVRNRKRTKLISDYLNANGIRSDFYHAGLDPVLRDKRQDEWIKGNKDVIVATNAFGMGIDKPDVRFVVHLDIPEGPEAYFQEAGSSGRDEQKAFAVLLYSKSDLLDLQKSFENSYPPIEEIRRVYQSLANYFKIATGSPTGMSFDFDLQEFTDTFKLNPVTTFNILKILERENYILFTEAVFAPSTMHISVNRDELYNFQVTNPNFDGFVKILLRSYGGLFDEFIKINEFDIARRAEIPVDKVIANLKRMNKLGLLSYHPKNSKPKILYTTERIDASWIKISSLEDLKKRSKERMDAMTGYVTSRHKCRSRMLLLYFGEKETEDCGICDVCIKRKNSGNSVAGYEKISASIFEMIRANKIQVKEIVERIGQNEELILEVIRQMIDNGTAGINDQQELFLMKK